MFNQKLFMFAVAGLLVPAADAAAEISAGKTTTVIPSPVNDKAPVTGTPLRLRKTDQEQAGHEHTSFALFADGKSGLHFGTSTELNGVAAPHRVQLSVVPFQLVQNADGSVEVKADLTKARFATDNDGNERRNANATVAFSIDEGKAVCAQYNYQPAGTNDTNLYIQCFDANGATVLPQTKAFSKTNDDCSMAETTSQLIDRNGATERYVRWHGCNGNGTDDAWVGVAKITKTATGYTYQREFDVSVLNNEERSRGNCWVGTDKTVAFCAGTDGNNQNQRNGVHLIAVDVTAGKFNGQGQQAALLWRKQLSGRKTIGGTTTYSMRAMINPVLSLDAAGKPQITDTFFFRHGDVQGSNTDDRKGGQYVQNEIAVIKATRAGFSFVTPASSEGVTSLLGIDGTHNQNTSALVGSGKDLKPALLVHNGSHTGGIGTSTIRAVGYDQATSKFANIGTVAGPYADRHLYSNYLGNNPGVQGRNHTTTQFIANPYFGVNGNNDQYVVVYASTGKGGNMNPAIKLAAFMSVIPVAQGAPAAAPATTTGTSGSTTDTTDTADESSDSSDTTLGGCSTSGSTGLATFLLIGLAAFIRRRR